MIARLVMALPWDSSGGAPATITPLVCCFEIKKLTPRETALSTASCSWRLVLSSARNGGSRSPNNRQLIMINRVQLKTLVNGTIQPLTLILSLGGERRPEIKKRAGV